MGDAQFVWVRVGDGDPEPAALEGTKPNRKATTIGCPDPFLVDEAGCPCKVLYDGNRCGKHAGEYLATIEVPDRPIGQSTAQKLAREYREYMNRQNHSYAGFGKRRDTP